MLVRRAMCCALPGTKLNEALTTPPSRSVGILLPHPDAPSCALTSWVAKVPPTSVKFVSSGMSVPGAVPILSWVPYALEAWVGIVQSPLDSYYPVKPDHAAEVR